MKLKLSKITNCLLASLPPTRLRKQERCTQAQRVRAGQSQDILPYHDNFARTRARGRCRRRLAPSIGNALHALRRHRCPPKTRGSNNTTTATSPPSPPTLPPTQHKRTVSSSCSPPTHVPAAGCLSKSSGVAGSLLQFCHPPRKQLLLLMWAGSAAALPACRLAW